MNQTYLWLAMFWIAVLTSFGSADEPVNLAFGKPVWANGPANAVAGLMTELLTDGDTRSMRIVAGPDQVQVNLERPRLINTVKLWHYWQDGRVYHGNRVAVTLENKRRQPFGSYTPWELVFDSDRDGEYPETAEGKTIEFPPRQVQYIHAWLGGIDGQPFSNWWVEIQAFYIPRSVHSGGKLGSIWARLKQAPGE